MTDLRAALTELLSDCHVQEVTEPRRLGGGSSQENWAFDARFETDKGPQWRPLLLRRDPVRGVVDTDRCAEFALLRRLNRTDLPVPRAYAFDDGQRLGRPAMVVDRLPGRAHRSLLRDSDPLGLGAGVRRQLAARLPLLLAAVHRVDVAGLGLSDVLPTTSSSPARDELVRWTAELDAVELGPQPALRATIGWLWRHLPGPPPRICLVHGDFRPANLLVDEAQFSALLDWELAHLGDPHDDLGWYTCPLYRREHFLEQQWAPDDFLRIWSKSTGWSVDPPRLHFWQVMATFRLAVIALTGIKSFCEGGTDRPAAPADRVIAAAVHATGLIAAAPGQGAQ